MKCIQANAHRISALNLPPVIHPECKGIDSRFSFYSAPVSNIYPKESWTITKLYKVITTPKYYGAITDELRKSGSPKNIKRYNLDYITVAGTFKKRGDSHILIPSGFMIIDIDKINNPVELKRQICLDENIDLVMAFISPSGNGLKLIIEVLFESFSTYFEGYRSYLKQRYHIDIDKSGKDISRSCFLCHDPEAHINGKYLCI
jgi:hypothetical protein